MENSDRSSGGKQPCKKRAGGEEIREMTQNDPGF